MKNLIFTTLCIASIVGQLAAQPPERAWLRRFDVANLSDYLNDVYPTTDGGFAACGYAAEERLHVGAWLVKTDHQGIRQWDRRYFRGIENETDFAYTLIQLDDEGYAVGGQFDQAGGGNTMKFGVLRTDSDGELLWLNTYGDEARYSDACFALIETKGGNILAVGRQYWQNGLNGYAVMIAGNGDVVWQRYYANTSTFLALREIEDEGFLLAGYDQLTKINQNGEFIWQRRHNHCRFKDMVSCGGQGFALVYTTGFNPPNLAIDTCIVLTRIDNDGAILWERSYGFDLDERYPTPVQYLKLARYNDGNFIIAASLTETANVNRRYSYLIQTDGDGNVMWERTDRNCPDPGSFEAYTSVVIHRDNAPAVAGWAVTENREFDGVLVRLIPSHSAPEILSQTPVSLDLMELQRDTVEFSVSVFDWQGDSISYEWKFGNEVEGTDTIYSRQFPDLGVFFVQCKVSDHDGSDSVRWRVDVRDLFIVRHSPDTLAIRLRRGFQTRFALDSVACIPQLQPTYAWSLTNLNSDERSELGDEERELIRFHQPGPFLVTGKVYSGESADSVSWNVDITGAIWRYLPENLQPNVVIGDSIRFEVVPLSPDTGQIDYRWVFNGENAGSSPMMTFSFDTLGEKIVRAIVDDGIESDNVTWRVNVMPLGIDGQDVRPTAFGLLSVSPNPFNSTVTIRYAVGFQTDAPRLTIHDITGREVFSTVRSPRLTENATVGFGEPTVGTVTWDATLYPAGIYFARLAFGSGVQTVKMVLVR